MFLGVGSLSAAPQSRDGMVRTCFRREGGVTEGSAVGRGFRKIGLGPVGTLGGRLWSGQGWCDLSAPSVSFQDIRGAQVAEPTGSPGPPAGPPE